MRSKQSFSKTMAMLVIAAAATLSGCHHAKPVPPAPPQPPAQTPTAKITANPSTLTAGEGVQLSWTTTNADTVTIEGVGQVSPTGSQTVHPNASSSYHLIAHGAGGTADDTVRVTVNAPAPVQESAGPPTQQASLSDSQLLEQKVPDLYFDYDSYQVRGEDQQKLQQAAQFLNTQKPNWNIVVEGYADERGSTEYNLALGDNRANAAKQALVTAGVSASRIQTVSFGKEKPFCTESTEACWQQNRRAHFRLASR